MLIAENVGEPDTSSVTLGSIKLKVKDTAITTTETISLTDVNVLDEAEETYEIDDATDVSITINAVSSSGGNTNKKSSTNTNTETDKENTYNPSTTANQSAPYTGVEDVMPIIFAVAVITIIAFIGIIKYRDIK